MTLNVQEGVAAFHVGPFQTASLGRCGLSRALKEGYDLKVKHFPCLSICK